MYSEIAGLLQQRTGIDPESVGMAMIERAVRVRMDQCGMQQVAAYLGRLRASEDEFNELIEAVVVPETWFFRDGEALTALARLAVGEWLPANPAGTLRVLSIPSSTGEEPYSIAIALLDAGVAPERFQVDAVDISQRALGHASEAVYGRNSFRSEEMGFRARYFKKTSDGYRLAQSVREQVHFEQGNLLDFSFKLGARPYDAIFCRNLLIYFDAPAQQVAVAKLDGLLADKGVLFVGPAEAYLMRQSQFTPIKRPRTFAFRKGGEASTLPPAQARPAQGPRRKAVVARPLPPLAPVQAAVAAPPLPVQENSAGAPVSAATGLEEAGRLADAGRLAEAAAMCEAYLQEEGATAAAYQLLGLVCDALGDGRKAGECYRKVLYLEPGHTEALAHLALLLEQQGDLAGARRLQQRGQRAEERARA